MQNFTVLYHLGFVSRDYAYKKQSNPMLKSASIITFFAQKQRLI